MVYRMMTCVLMCVLCLPVLADNDGNEIMPPCREFAYQHGNYIYITDLITYETRRLPDIFLRENPGPSTIFWVTYWGWSANGRYLIYRDYDPELEFILKVYDVDAEQHLSYDYPSPFNIFFSPDLSMIAYTEITDTTSKVWIMDLFSGEKTLAHEITFAFDGKGEHNPYVVWKGNGTSIVFIVAYDDGFEAVYKYDFESETLELLHGIYAENPFITISNNLFLDLLRPSSPNMRFHPLVDSTESGTDVGYYLDIWMIDLNTGDLHPVFEDFSWFATGTRTTEWSPNSRWFPLNTLEPNTDETIAWPVISDLYVYDTQTQQTYRITNTPFAHETVPFWHDDNTARFTITDDGVNRLVYEFNMLDVLNSDDYEPILVATFDDVLDFFDSEYYVDPYVPENPNCTHEIRYTENPYHPNGEYYDLIVTVEVPETGETYQIQRRADAIYKLSAIGWRPFAYYEYQSAG